MSIFINIFEHIVNDATVSMHIGGRRCGKTYSATSTLIDKAINTDCKIMYLRRTDDEIVISTENDVSDWAKLNRDFGYDINFKTEHKVTRMFNGDKHIGYAAALSTIRKLRGINFDEITDILYDEFIPEPHAKKISREDWALFSAYDTINGAREMLGLPPCRLYMLANIFNLLTPIFDTLQLTDIIFNMLSAAGTKTYYDNTRDLSVAIYDEADYKAAREQTTIGRLTKGTSYFDMAVNNRIIVDDIKRVSLSEYHWLSSVLDIDLWEHKSNGQLYICKRNNPKSDTYQNVDLFRATFFKLVQINYLNNNIVYQTAHCKSQLAHIFPKLITF